MKNNARTATLQTATAHILKGSNLINDSAHAGNPSARISDVLGYFADYKGIVGQLEKAPSDRLCDKAYAALHRDRMRID